MKQENSKDHQPSLVGVYLGGGCLKDGKHKAHQFFGRLPVSARVIYALDQTPQIDRVVAIVPDITFTSSWIDHLSFSMLAQSKLEGAVVLPVVQKEQMAGINHLHNIHFYPGKDGYFQFGNAAVISHKVRNLIDLERFNIYYAGKSFRNNPKAKLKAAASGQ